MKLAPNRAIDPAIHWCYTADNQSKDCDNG